MARTKRKSTSLRKAIFLVVILNFILLGYVFNDDNSNNPDNTKVQKIINITGIVDGDTIDSDIGRIRLMGINTPEKGEYLYQEAKDYLEQYKGRIMIFEDFGEDKYTRRLGYLFDKETGVMVNSELISLGLAHSYYYENDEYTNTIKNKELTAINSAIGLWEKSKNSCAACVYLEQFDNGKDKDDCSAGTEYLRLTNDCNNDCYIDGWIIKDESSKTYTFTRMIMRPRDSVMIYNGKGKDYGNIIYFNNPEACASIWNDDHDIIFLRDKEGKLVWFYAY